MKTIDEIKSNITNITNAAFAINNKIGVYKNHSIKNNNVIVELIFKNRINGTIEIPVEIAKVGYDALNNDILESIAKTFKPK